ncbi:MAG: hypothetical protein R3Y28_01600 [Candidatus Gastranaerophilales bacterium]
MKNLLVFLSLLVLCTMAYIDLKDRLIEIDRIGANTPAQVELNQSLSPSSTQSINQDINSLTPLKDKQPQKLYEKINDNSSGLQNPYNSVLDRRNTITNPVQ